ncbi:septation regulator SpoVG [Acholeplasma granularum]|uniref:septation regulator SpoVG n=1 Tax=Acholeplasma granularum TaxID=264635 RepID=UPI00046E879D|nr:septation regulator SpoVG [Acholeplasma granularum]
MQVTDVRVRLVDSESRLKAVATITFESAFVVHDIRVIEGENGIFVAMPSKKMPNGGFRDIAHPIHQEMRKQIEDAIVEAYHKTVAENPEGAAGQLLED